MKQFGLIGYPLGHSFSKRYFTQKFEKEHINAVYNLYELEKISEFKDLIARQNINGLNVTIPYKEQVLPYLDEVDDVAKIIGAVNVVKFVNNSGHTVLKGYNSDVVGFENSLKPFLSSKHTKALVLGTGGASKAIVYVLKKLGVEVQLVSRQKSFSTITYDEINEQIISDCLLIINASPVGTFPHVDQAPHIPYQFLSESHLLYDVVYNPSTTLFMRKGAERGATVLNGEQMLILQAEEAWTIWNS